jgi:ribosome-binding factor A
MTAEGGRRRQRRIGALIQQELSDLLQRELRDPGLGFATVTEVRVSTDLKRAQVYVSVMGDEEERRGTMAALQRGEGFIRRELASRLKLRHMPEIEFAPDLTLERAARLDALLDQALPSVRPKTSLSSVETVRPTGSAQPVHDEASAGDGSGS